MRVAALITLMKKRGKFLILIHFELFDLFLSFIMPENDEDLNLRHIIQ